MRGTQRCTHRPLGILYRHRACACQAACAIEHLNLVLAHQKRHPFGEAIGDLTAAANDFFKIKSDIIAVESEFLAPLDVLINLSVVE